MRESATRCRPASRRRSRLHGARKRLANEESGFTIVEVMVASGVILVALTMLAGVLSTGLKATGIARQRQSATGLANQALEQVRALPFATVQRGLDTTDLANTAGTTDPAVTTSGCSGNYCFQGERLVHGTNPPQDPLVPHQRSTTVGPTTYSIATYVTVYAGGESSQVYRVTSIVSWENALRGGKTDQVQAQTLLYTSADCLSLTVHPRSGPCEPSFSASAKSDPGSVTIRGTLAGLSIDNVTLYSSSSTSDATIEQTSRVEGSAQLSGAKLRAIGGSEQTLGRASVTSAADNDPEGSLADYQSTDAPSGTPVNGSLAVGTDSIAVAGTAGDTGRTTSTAAASTTSSPARLCPNLTGVLNDNDGRPCGASTARTASTISANASVATGALGTFSLASMGPAVSPNTTTTDRYTTTGDGAARADVTRSALSYQLVGLPAALRPLGFDYFVKLSSYADSASAHAGVGAPAPAATTSGTLSFYTGALLNPYTNINLSSVTSSTTIPPLTLSFPLLGINVSLSATITPETRTVTSTTTPAGCTGSCTRTESSATITPLRININAQITLAGLSLVNTTLSVDPGTVRTKTTYTPSPTV